MGNKVTDYSTSELITLFDPHHNLWCEIESKVINFFKADVIKHLSGHERDYRLTLDAEDLCFEVHFTLQPEDKKRCG